MSRYKVKYPDINIRGTERVDKFIDAVLDLRKNGPTAETVFNLSIASHLIFAQGVGIGADNASVLIDNIMKMPLEA